MPIPVPRTPVRVRIAPSPTGDPHVGTAYIALFNAAFARHHGGQFLLRIEDTDQKRSTRASEDAILRSLKWIGLEWDEGPDVGGPCGPYRQSERGEIYRSHCDTLIEKGKAYRCFCTAERLDQMRAVQRAAKVTSRYDGYCRQLDPEESRQRAQSGEAFVVRLAMPTEGESVVPDALRGPVVYDNRQIDDQVLLKTDGLPTYHLANVVDDHLMAITHVIRAEEWINSTPKHLALYQAFGWEPPVFVHMPLLRNEDKSKISKRKNPTSLEFYQRSGILPEAMLNFLGLMGYSMQDEREQFSFTEFASELDLARVSLGGPVFDLKKLDWLNGMYLRAMTPESLALRTFAYYREDDRHGPVSQLVQERVTSLADYMDHADIFYGGQRNPGLFGRHLLIGCTSRKKNAVRLGRQGSRAYVEDVIARLEAEPNWEPAAIEAALRAAVTQAGVLVGDGLMAVRVAVCGRPTSPPLFETMHTIGRAVTLVRLRAAVAQLGDERMLQDAIAHAQAELDAVREALQAAEAAVTPTPHQSSPAAEA
jgi:glutamyl-tRNA synthetase